MYNLNEKFFKYLDLPTIPVDLIEKDLHNLESKENIFVNKNYFYYKQFNVSQQLKNYIESIFDSALFISYQVIRNGIAIHKDVNRYECCNYIIDNGGDNSRLTIYDEDKVTVLHSEHVVPLKWHCIDVSKYHGISGLVRPRISISVTTKK